MAATLGSTVGAVVLYALAAAIGPQRLQRLTARYGRWFGLEVGDLKRAENWFDQRAERAVLICRCVPLMRSLISLPAGVRRMPLPRFLVLTMTGSLVWNTALIGAGYVMGDRWESVGRPIEYLQGLVVAGIVVAVAWFVWRRIIRRRPAEGPGRPYHRSEVAS